MDEENPQVVLYLVDGQTHLGITATVFRGAQLKSKSKPGSRRLRSTKPSLQSLTVASCAKVRLFRAQGVTGNDRQFAVSASSTVDLLDPVGSLLGQMVPTSVAFKGFMDAALLVLRFSEKQIACVEQVKQKPSLFIPKELGEIPVPEVQHNVYSHRSFKQGVAGTKNIIQFMEELPKHFESRGLPFLEQGFCVVGAEKVAWKELVQQVPDYFDVVTVGCNKDSFGKVVLTKFAGLTADAEGKQKLTKFLKDVRAAAAPVFRTQRNF